MRNSKYPLIQMLWALSVLGLPLTVSMAHADTDAQSELKPGNPVYDLWDQFYKAEKNDPTQAEQILVQLSQKTPQDVRVWKSLTYLQISQKRPEDALKSIAKARELTPQDEELALQQAYLLNGLGRNAEAVKVFKTLQNSSNPQTKATADQAILNLQGDSASSHPYFADIYFSPSYEDRFSMGVAPLKVRAGRYFGEGQQGQIYGFASLNKDTKSKGNSNPATLHSNALIYDDNAVIAGVGVNYQPWLNLPIRAYAEVGVSYDLIDRDRSKTRESITAGITGYDEWQFSKLGESANAPNWYADAYGNIATYSREDYSVLSDLRGRSGLNFADHGVKLYGKVHAINDTAQRYYNNLIEAGPGISWKPFQQFPATLSVEQLYGKYVSGTPADTKDSYNNTRVELTIYHGF